MRQCDNATMRQCDHVTKVKISLLFAQNQPRRNIEILVVRVVRVGGETEYAIFWKNESSYKAGGYM